MNTHYPLIIIGSGPAGLTAGIYASRSNLGPLIIDGHTPGGQLMGTSLVENWPGEKSIMGPQLMHNMREQAKGLGALFKSGSIVSMKIDTTPFVLKTNKDEQLTADAVIVATGATPKRIGCPGEDAYWGKGVTTCAVCDGAFYEDQPVVIVGGGDTAMEDAAFMTKFTDQITVVQIHSTLTASHAMQQRVINNPNITIIYNSTVTKIVGDGSHISQVVITHQETKQETILKTRAVFVAIGLKPNTEFLVGKTAMNEYGYVLQTKNTQTSVPGIFAAGDVTDYQYRQAITSAGSGCKAALDVEKYLQLKNERI